MNLRWIFILLVSMLFLLPPAVMLYLYQRAPMVMENTAGPWLDFAATSLATDLERNSLALRLSLAELNHEIDELAPEQPNEVALRRVIQATLTEPDLFGAATNPFMSNHARFLTTFYRDGEGSRQLTGNDAISPADKTVLLTTINNYFDDGHDNGKIHFQRRMLTLSGADPSEVLLALLHTTAQDNTDRQSNLLALIISHDPLFKAVYATNQRLRAEGLTSVKIYLFNKGTGQVEAFVCEPECTLVFHDPIEDSSTQLRQFLAPLIQSTKQLASDWSLMKSNTEPLLVVTTPVELVDGHYLLVIVNPLAEAYHAVRQTKQLLWIIVLASISAGVVILTLFIGWTYQRLRRAGAALERLATDADAYAGTDTDELGPSSLRGLGVLGASYKTLHQSLLQRDRLLEELKTRSYQATQASDQYRALVEALPDGVMTVNKQGTIQSVNAQMARLSGYSIEALIGMSVDQLVPADRRNGHEGRRDRYARNPHRRRMGAADSELHLQSSDDLMVPVEVALAPLPSTTEDSLVVAVVRDISERVEAGKLTEEKRFAEAASRAKSLFLANMSHEIRTPLHGVLGNLELLQHTPLEKRQLGIVERSRVSAQSLLGVINDILDFSKIEAGHLALMHDPFPLRRTLEECAISLYEHARSKGVSLIVDMESGPEMHVLGDSQRLSQVCINLLGNAIKFTTTRPAATVSLRLRILGRTDTHLSINLEINDNGIGMNEHQQRRILEPFMQANLDTTRRFGGTGLGLAIVTEILELMGSHLQVESTLDIGSRCSVDLDLLLNPAQSALESPAINARVLLSVNMQEIATPIERHLRAMGVEVITVASQQAIAAEVARAQGTGQQFDLILVCPELLHPDPQELKQLNTHALPVLLLIDNETTHHRLLGPWIQLLGYPYRMDMLLEQVAAITGQRELVNKHTSLNLRPLDDHPIDVLEAEALGRLILVAEDNEVNQQVLDDQLSLLGNRVVIAANGQVALDLFSKHRFAAVLSDAHMPILDGYGLVKAIRNLEVNSEARTPLLIITADATLQEAERCRSAGADDILTKPLALSDLRRVLDRWLPAEGGDVRATALPPGINNTDLPASAALPIWDRDTLPRIVGDNEATQQRLLHKFFDSAPEQIAAITVSATSDPAAAAAQAHKLKSSARAMGALALGEVCRQLESAYVESGGNRLPRLAETLNTAFSQLRDKFEQELL
ncbi:MAG: PAS domain S-box-containing protein [Motiliproteus sp.]|jgi:PAS domain S-box-containing protein